MQSELPGKDKVVSANRFLAQDEHTLTSIVHTSTVFCCVSRHNLLMLFPQRRHCCHVLLIRSGKHLCAVRSLSTANA